MAFEGERSKVLIIGGTGNVGRRLVNASISIGHPTFVLFRPENESNQSKCQILMELKMRGAHLLQGSLSNHGQMVSLLKQVDVVICALGGMAMLEQLKIVDAIKEAGNIKRFLPTEYGMEADRLHHAIQPGKLIFEYKRDIRRAIEKSGIPYTYIIANCFAGYFLAGLAQLGVFTPPRDHVVIYDKGSKQCVWVDEDDVAFYSLLTISDPRTENKIVHIRPPANKMSQMEVVKVWEDLTGKELKKTFIPEEEWLLKLDRTVGDLRMQIDMAHVYQMFYRGDLDFELEEPGDVDTAELYPDHKYVTVEEYLKRFL